MARAGAIVLASDPEVAAVGRAILSRGNAVDAAAAGVFAAAGLYASVLLGPVQLLIGGAGAGLRAVDGRARQPGLGYPRPRGFLATEAVPDAARVGVPALPAALLAAATTYGKLSVAALVGPGVELARARSTPRAALLDRIAQRGPAALSDRAVADDLTLLAGRLAGGLLSVRDLDEVRPRVAAAAVHPSVGGRHVVTVPWGASAVSGAPGATHVGHDVRVVVAADRNGMLAVACYEVPKAGVVMDVFELVAPFTASPVMRGEPRVRPGEPRGAAAPIALRQVEGVLDLAAGIGASGHAEAALGAWLRQGRAVAGVLRAEPLPEGLVALERAGSEWVSA